MRIAAERLVALAALRLRLRLLACPIFRKSRSPDSYRQARVHQ